MEDDLISSLYPPPPPYYKFFTQENLNSLEQLQNSTPDEPVTGKLKFLLPPEKPEGLHYRGYGNIWSFEDKLPSLKDSGWEQLYQDEDEHITLKTKIDELHKLMDSLLLNFLELIGTMSIEPSKFHIKIEQLKLILININHILNTYRPHQTRESLIMLLRKQIEKKKNEINSIDLTCNRVKQGILKLVEDIQETGSVTSDSDSPRDEIIKSLIDEK